MGSVTFSKVTGENPAILLKVTYFHGCFSRFLNCINGTKLRKILQWLYTVQEKHYIIYTGKAWTQMLFHTYSK